MKNLVNTPDFDGLPSLQKLELFRCDKLEEIHPSLGNLKSLELIYVYNCSNLKKFPPIDHIIELKYLKIHTDRSDFEIPEIQSDMENLVEFLLNSCSRQEVFFSSVAVHCPNLISLDVKCSQPNYVSRKSLSYFSRLYLNLSRLTVLVHLDLSYCDSIVKLPEFPSTLTIFIANECNRLTEIGDEYRNCKRLCQVSVLMGAVITDGNRLLQSMLQGKPIENHSMVLYLEGLRIPREFRPRLRDRTRYTLQLPENWRNDFCGFLMCAVIKNDYSLRIKAGIEAWKEIIMEHARGAGYNQFGADWKEGNLDRRTWVWYVSYASLRDNGTWLPLHETCKAVSFSFGTNEDEMCQGFGVSLVPRTSGSGPTDDTSPLEYCSESDKQKYDFKPEFEINDDFMCSISIPTILNEYLYWM